MVSELFVVFAVMLFCMFIVTWAMFYWKNAYTELFKYHVQVVDTCMDRLMSRDLPEYVQAKAVSEVVKEEKPPPYGLEEFAQRMVGE